MIVCFGSINLDLIFPLPHLPTAGQTVLGADLHIEPGGKGANQAVAAARDGAKVLFAGAVGEDRLAEDALVTLRSSGVDITRVARSTGATGCAAICVDPHGRNLIAVASAANFAARGAQVEDAVLDADTVLLVQRETESVETEELIRRAARLGARIVLNLAPYAPIAEAALRDVDLLIVNEHEAAGLARDLGCAPTAAGLHARLGIGVVVTLGEAGLEAVTGTEHLRIAAHHVVAIDTTGAGDCFTGVLCAALDRGLPLKAALRRANVAAGLCCTRKGTQGSMPSGAEIDAAMAG